MNAGSPVLAGGAPWHLGAALCLAEKLAKKYHAARKAAPALANG